ncbi:septum formation initiator family protein [Terrilactibacillus sp. S3-3]|nr:septum formation initiator family protein [Terrilactibacillus sp. S3-3]
MVSSIFSQSSRLSSTIAQKEHLEKKLQASKKDTKVLKQHIRLLHDKDYIGEIARRDYLLSKKGEIIFSKPNIDKH